MQPSSCPIPADPRPIPSHHTIETLVPMSFCFVLDYSISKRPGSLPTFKSVDLARSRSFSDSPTPPSCLGETAQCPTQKMSDTKVNPEFSAPQEEEFAYSCVKSGVPHRAKNRQRLDTPVSPQAPSRPRPCVGCVGFGFRVQRSGFRFRVSGSLVTVQGSGFRVGNLGSGVSGRVLGQYLCLRRS